MERAREKDLVMAKGHPSLACYDMIVLTFGYCTCIGTQIYKCIPAGIITA